MRLFSCSYRCPTVLVVPRSIDLSKEVDMHHRNSFLSPAFYCLFAATVLLAGLQQARTQTPAAVSAPGSQSVSSERLPGHTVSQVRNGTATRVSHYNPEQKLRLALVVQPPHMAEEEQFLKDLTTKSSPPSTSSSPPRSGMRASDLPWRTSRRLWIGHRALA